ncbi:MAG: hypothetical protein ACK4V6_11635 [Microthrixaceae bacterium]
MVDPSPRNYRWEKGHEPTRGRISQLGHATLRNAARRTGEDLEHLPDTVGDARAWLADRFEFHDVS